MDKAIDKTSLAVTSNNQARAEGVSNIAEERLAEVKTMIEKDKLDAAEKA